MITTIFKKFFLKKQPPRALAQLECLEIEPLENAEQTQIVGGKRIKLGFFKFRGNVRNGSPNASILNRVSGKRLG